MAKKTKKTKKTGEQHSTGRFFTGRLEITRSGMGFLVMEGDSQDVLIKRDNIRNALNGDEVKVEVIKLSRGGGRAEGKVVEVLRRKQTEFSGRVDVHPHFAFLITDSDKMPLDIFIPLHLLGEAKNGDHAVAKIVEWTGKTKNPVGEIVSILTNETRNEIAMQGILMENGFPLTFPDEVLEEAARYPEGVDSAEVKKRRDMRDTLTFTIDPVDAKDFDDAISYKVLKGGVYEIGVHIADVSHYIEKDSVLDKEAYHRATSVYLPDRVLPMLPERLSNELCSLRPNEDKYTFSAVFQVTKEGKVKDYWLGRTIIHSRRRFTYEEVQEIIEGAEGDLKEEILLVNELSQNLRKARFKKGAINFSSQEVRFKLDEKGKPIGIVVKESKEAHQLIEELMLLANRTVAEYVSGKTVKDKPVPFPYRVHDQPDEEKLKVFMMFAGKYGHKFNLSSPDSIARSFNEMLKLVQGKPEQHVLESLGIRTMAKAVYTTENIGHYGLGFENYCHFTSPIRRYPDVLVHRILQECLDADIHPVKHLEQQCRHCSDQERRAMEAERAANKYKQVEFMMDHVGEEFEAVVSGVSGFGFWAETVDHKCEGMVSMTDLNTIDDFELKEGEYALLGRHTGIRFGVGDKVKIQVAAANLDKRQLDYSILEAPQGAKAGRGDTRGMERQPYKPERPKGGAGRKKDPKRKK
ncbi:MAG: ribonuclease R [Flavipsychrobacter sp.]|nr:ribonuclease R [Flavipsychrobacter sp.]